MSHRPEVIEGCKRLTRNAVVCWKPLDLTQRISLVADANTRTALPEWVAAGSAVSWHQINPIGETHFSERETPGLAFRVAGVGISLSSGIPGSHSSAISRARGRVSATFSDTILSITVKGTASTIPTTPQHSPQNASAISTTSGLRSTA